MKINNMRFNFSKLNQPIEIYELKQVIKDGLPQKPEPVIYISCFAHVEQSSLKDFQNSVQTGTKSLTKVFIRNYPGITNKMQLKHYSQKYKIKEVLYDFRQSGFSIILAEQVSLV